MIPRTDAPASVAANTKKGCKAPSPALNSVRACRNARLRGAAGCLGRSRHDRDLFACGCLGCRSGVRGLAPDPHFLLSIGGDLARPRVPGPGRSLYGRLRGEPGKRPKFST